MTTKTLPARVTMTRLYCDHCPDVEMQSTGYAELTSPPHYRFYCPECGATISTTVLYPAIGYEEWTPNP